MAYYFAKRRAVTQGSGSWYPAIVKGASESPKFVAPLNTSGVDLLSPQLTINSTMVEPTLRVKGGDASASGWTAWGYGNDLAYAGSGSAPDFNNGSVCIGNNDDALKFNAGKYFQSSSGTHNDIGTEDFVIEMLINVRNNTTTEIVSKFAATYLVIDKVASGANYYFSLSVVGGSGSASVSSSVYIDPGWHHVMLFYDASGSAIWYIDGSGSGSASVVSGVGTLTNAALFTLGARSGGAAPDNGDLAYFSLWKSSSWLDTHVQTTVAQDRFRRLCGIHPTTARGSSTPTSWARSTNASLDTYDSVTGVRRIHYVPTSWLRIAQRPAGNGYLSESQSTNLATDSEDASAWTTTNTAVTVDQSDAPDELTSMDLITDDIIVGLHTVSQSITMTGTTPVVFSCWAKKGTSDYIWLGADVNGSQRYSFNLDTGTVDTQISGTPNAGIEDWGNGIYRCWLRATPSGSGAYTFSLGVTMDGSTVIYSGSSDTIYVWGAQCEQTAGIDSPSSYIHTRGGSAVTRSFDRLRYKGDDGNLGDVTSNFKGTIKFSAMGPNETPDTTIKMMLALHDGGSGTDVIYISTDGTDVIERYIDSAETASENQVGTTSMSDGVFKDIKITCRLTDTKIYVDNALEIDGAVASCPDNINGIDVGVWTSANLQWNGLISNLKLYKGIV